MSLNCYDWRPALEYARQPESWWNGKRVRLLRDIRTNGGDFYRKGRTAKVMRKFGGLTLEGRQLYATRVHYYCLEVEATASHISRKIQGKPRNARR